MRSQIRKTFYLAGRGVVRFSLFFLYVFCTFFREGVALKCVELVWTERRQLCGEEGAGERREGFAATWRG